MQYIFSLCEKDGIFWYLSWNFVGNAGENGWEIWGIGMWIGGWMERISSILRWLGDYGRDHRLWSRLHPRTKTRPVHPPPPDRSIEASVGIQCSLFIVNTPPLPTTHSDISPWLGRCVYCPGRWRKVESSLLAVDWLIWVQNVGKHFAAVYEPAPLHRRRRAVVKIVGASRLFSIVLAGSWARDASNCLIFTAPASELLNCMRG